MIASMKGLFIFLSIAVFQFGACAAVADVFAFRSGDATVWVDCEKRVPVMSDILVRGVDVKPGFDNEIAAYPSREGCYAGDYVGKRFDEFIGPDIVFAALNNPGLAAVEDATNEKILRSPINAVPMKGNLYFGAWRATEKIIACESRAAGLRVMSGSYWKSQGNNRSFQNEYGVVAPDFFWRVIQKKYSVIAWIFPNSQNAVESRLDRYLVSVSELEKKIGIQIPIDGALKNEAAFASWPVREDCGDLSNFSQKKTPSPERMGF